MRIAFMIGFVWITVAACGVGMGGIGQNNPLASAVETAACPELGGGAMNASFEADARANSTIKAFVQAAGDFARVAAKAEADVGAACQRMGTDLGLTASEMTPRGDQSATAAACAAVGTRMDAILSKGVRASIKAEATPPKCTANASVEASCKGQCSAELDPGYVKAHCQPGQLHGRCDATCSGSCSGTCNGNCQGQCAGATGATSANGQCNGQCNGTCQGSCRGDCKGSCSVELVEPKCAVAVKAPSADARCEGNCKADANLRAQCTPAQVRVESSINAGEMPKLVATLQANLPTLIQAEAQYGARVAGDVDTLVRTGSELPNAFGQLTAHAGSCIAAAANATLRAQASIRVSVEASASISAKAGARGTAG